LTFFRLMITRSNYFALFTTFGVWLVADFKN
jgi:hypothetical protein